MTSPASVALAVDHPRWVPALAIIAGSTALRIAIGRAFPPVPDEAYYWAWSTHLAAGFFDHPPMIALLIRAGTIVLGATPIGVRLGPILAGTVAALAVAAISGRIGGGAAPLRAAIVMAVLPIAAAGLVLATPDAPLLATFAATLYFVVRAVGAPVRSRASLGWWVLAGTALGAAFCSKYTSIFLPVGVLLAFATRRELRRRFAEPGPYAACLIATCIFLPVLFWNSAHDWVSFGYQVRHGLSAPNGSALRAAYRNEGDFIGGQLALVSPILFVLMAIAVMRAARPGVSTARWVVAIVSLVSFVFFVLSGLRQHVEPNWPAPAYVGAIALVAVAPWGTAGRRWVIASVALAGVISALIYADAISPILVRAISPHVPGVAVKDPVARAFGWDALTAAALSAGREPGPSSLKHAWIAGDRYQDAAELAFHGDADTSVAQRGIRLETFALNLTGRPNQYDLWPGFAERAAPGDRLVLVVDDGKDIHPAVARLAPYFESILRGERVELRRDSAVVGSRRIYSLDGWRGGWPGR